MSKPSLIELMNLSVGHNDNGLLENLNLNILEGDFICLMGPNGSGKSTFLRTIASLHKPISGVIKINGQCSTQISPNELSKLVSIVLTERIKAPGLLVEDIIRLGRFPHTNRWGRLENIDRKIISESIDLLNLEELKKTQADELSDGQLQKVYIARALAQDTPLIILDEPTTFLDFVNRMELMNVLKKISKIKNKALLYSSHDWELTLETCSKLWLIDSNKKIKIGAPEEFLYNGTIEKAFRHENFYLDKKSGRYSDVKELNQEISLSCEDALTEKWITHALLKVGYKVVQNNKEVIIFKDNLYKLNNEESFESLSSLLDYLKLNQA